MLPSLLSSPSQAPQPFVFLEDGGVYVLSTRVSSPAALVTACGVRHPLRLLASPRTWQEHSARIARGPFTGAVLDQQARRGLISIAALAAWFLGAVVPAFESRDLGDGIAAPTQPDLVRTDGAPPIDLDAHARQIPPPTVPAPSLMVLGRAWLLADRVRPAGVHVRARDRALGLTGDYVTLGSLRRTWETAFHALVDDVASRLEPRAAIEAEAQRELADTAALERGELLLVAGDPPRLAHVIPPHFNRTLGRASNRDLALATVLNAAMPTSGGPLCIIQRQPTGRWSIVETPHGVCLGKDMPSAPAGTDAVLLTPCLLRWGAVRIASNGRFHEGD